MGKICFVWLNTLSKWQFHINKAKADYFSHDWKCFMSQLLSIFYAACNFQIMVWL